MPRNQISRLEILRIGRHGDIVDMKGEAQFQTGEVWEEGLRRRMPNPLDVCSSVLVAVMCVFKQSGVDLFVWPVRRS